MSTPEDQSELRAGHPPAVKVGGMRITQHKSPTPPEKPVVENPKKEGEEEEEEENVEGTSPPKQPHLVISGALARGDADFPTEAVQAYHTKPVPSHDYQRNSPNKPNMIQQPRKQ